MATDDRKRGQDTNVRCGCGRDWVVCLMPVCSKCFAEAHAAFWATMESKGGKQ